MIIYMKKTAGVIIMMAIALAFLYHPVKRFFIPLLQRRITLAPADGSAPPDVVPWPAVSVWFN
jgi:hypothetical protein